MIYDRFRGVLPKVKEPGMHFKMPYIQYPHIYDVKSRPRTVNTSTGSKDLQQVNISLRILSHPIPVDITETRLLFSRPVCVTNSLLDLFNSILSK